MDPKSSGDHQHICHTGQFIVATWFLTKKLQQSLIFQRQFRALARTVAECSLPDLGNKSSGRVFFAFFLPSHLGREILVSFRIGLFGKVGFNAFVALVEVFRFARATIVSTLFVWPDVSSFLFPVTHNFHLLFAFYLRRSAHKTDTCPPALPQFRPLIAAGWLGIGGHLRVLQCVTFTPHTI